MRSLPRQSPPGARFKGRELHTRRHWATALLLVLWSAGISPDAGTTAGTDDRRGLPEGAGELRLLFTGDILLSRQVQAEMDRTGQGPWDDWPPIFRHADWTLGNLEGAVGLPSDCAKTARTHPCFAIREPTLARLRRSGIRTLGLANNHAADLGEPGLPATRAALARAGLEGISFAESPSFRRLGGFTLGLVAFSMVPRADGQRVDVASVALAQKLRLARRLANLVAVYVHWGNELLEWPDTDQRRAAEWLIGQGADLIVGHHPHVVQPAECIRGKPVFYSLGNHVFDQKYPATKQGTIADCRIAQGRLRCVGIATRAPAESAFPRIAQGAPESGSTASPAASCTVALGPDFAVAGLALRPLPTEPGAVGGGARIRLEAMQEGRPLWRTRPLDLLALDTGRLAGPDAPALLVALERHPSPLDREVGPRPYVYRVTAQGLIPRWRGTALAWPLIDAALSASDAGVLCALHRGDSFLVPDAATASTRVAAYRWNGFGFSGVDDAAVVARCAELWPAIGTGNACLRCVGTCRKGKCPTRKS